MYTAILTLLAGGVIVLIAALLFTNAIEYLGFKMGWTGSFVGAILAPLFTSFPELTVFLVAIYLYGGISGEEIGIGTIYGQPFMASSLSYGLVGLVVLIGYYIGTRDDLVLEVEKHLAIPYLFITILFPLTLVPALIQAYIVKVLFACLFLASYITYTYMMYSRRIAEVSEEANPPYLIKVFKFENIAIALQLFISILMLYYGSKVLVGSVDDIARYVGIEPIALSLIVVPAVTALPETASALIWGFRGKDTLSIASLVGEKILYSTFYPALGIILTSWEYNIHAGLSVLATTIISLILLYYIWRCKVPWYALLIGLIFFISYAYIVFILHI